MKKEIQPENTQNKIHMKNYSFIIKGNIHNLRSIFADCIELGLTVSDVPYHDPFRRSEIKYLIGQGEQPIAGFACLPDRLFENEFVLPNQYSECYKFLHQLAKNKNETNDSKTI